MQQRIIEQLIGMNGAKGSGGDTEAKLRERLLRVHKETQEVKGMLVARLRHLNGALEATSNEDAAYQEWHSALLPRLSADYCQRAAAEVAAFSHHHHHEPLRTRSACIDYGPQAEDAVHLKEASREIIQKHHLEAFSDSRLLDECDEMQGAIREARFGPVLVWASEHRASLKRIESDIEFQLRKADFIQHLRQLHSFPGTPPPPQPPTI